MKRTPLRRKTPLKQTAKPRTPKKSKPTSRRKKLEAQTRKWAKVFYCGVPCVICGATNTCGHHIVPRSRCRPGLNDPANIIPLCPSHHTMGNETSAHSMSSIVVGRFIAWMGTHMPKRWEACRELDRQAKQGGRMTIDEIEADHAFWEAVMSNGRDYAFVCDTAGVEGGGRE